jgi:uncharacterized protein YegJ (DUF2314 family)
MPTYSLLSAEEQHRRTPLTFSIIDKEKRDAVAVGDIVKLAFHVASGPNGIKAERMWVRIVKIEEPGVFLGQLDSKPTYVLTIEQGDGVGFKSEHIYDILPRPESLEDAAR